MRCTCIRDGRAKPHPFPERLTFDETGAPSLTGDPSTEDWIAHDRWFAESCEHAGFLVSARLGNISLAEHVRHFLRGLEADPDPRFPILLDKVVYDGTHSGDCISSEESVALLKEVDTVLHSRDILASSEEEFFSSLKRLCEASIETGNPIVF